MSVYFEPGKASYTIIVYDWGHKWAYRWVYVPNIASKKVIVLKQLVSNTKEHWQNYKGNYRYKVEW